MLLFINFFLILTFVFVMNYNETHEQETSDKSMCIYAKRINLNIVKTKRDSAER